MHCIRCKKEIDANSLRCKFCGAKVQTVCPECKSLNLLTAEYCTHCHTQLIKYCPSCKSANLPKAEKCRKCGFVFSDKTAAFEQTNTAQEETSVPAAPEENSSIRENEDFMPSIQEVKPFSMFEEQKIELEASAGSFDEPIENSAEHITNELPEIELDNETQDKSEEEKAADEIENYSDNYEALIKKQEEEEFSDNISVETDAQSQTEPEQTYEEDTDFFDLSTLADDDEYFHGETDLKTNINQSSQPAKQAPPEPAPQVPPAHPKQVGQVQKPAQAASAVGAEEKKNEPVVPPVREEIESGELTSEDNELQENTVQEVLNESMREIDQLKSKNLMVAAVKSNDKKIIGLSSVEGYGKSTVLRYLFNELLPLKYAWLWGECSANSQISPFGIFQEMFLTFFNLPNYSNMSGEFQKETKKLLQKVVPTLTDAETGDLFNFLYPALTAHFEEILVNKEYSFKLLEKVILEISQRQKLIIVIDDFDMIDGASYEFLMHFINEDYLSENIKLIVAYKDKRISQGYFYSEKIAENEYQDVFLSNLTYEHAINLTRLFMNGANPIPEDVFKQIYENSKGNSAFIEQILVLLNENGAFETKDDEIIYKSTPIALNLPKNLFEILTQRLNILKEKFPTVHRTLCTAAIMGNKFNIKLLEHVMKISFDDFRNVIQMLVNSAYLTQFNDNMFAFKNTLMWKFVYERAKMSEDFTLLNERIFDVINNYTLSSNALKALVAQNLNQKLLAMNIWTDNVKLCAYLGDEHLWALSQKQCLKIAQEINPETNNLVITNIQERLGKLLYLSKPSEAMNYLSNSLSTAVKLGNKPKIIELAGYLSKSCDAIGNYHGVIETVDTVLKLIDYPEYKLESALIKYKKLRAILSIGNSEEIYNTANNEIIPIIEQAIAQSIPTKDIPMSIIYETWLECNLIVANALIIQGNKKCLNVLNFIDEIVAKNHITNKNYLLRVALSKALAYSMLGIIKKSEGILIEISQKTANEIVEPEIISQWNFINILNKILKKDWANIKEELFSVVTFANNYNDVLIKNLLKTFLGKVLQEEDNLSKALDIFNEQVTIFAREKIAVGALLCWYYIAKVTLVTDGTDKALDITQKALDVAKNPKINNYYFMVLYKRLIAEIYMIKGDMEAARMYIEKALLIVKTYGMKLHKVMLYELYAKYLEEMIHKKPQNKNNYSQKIVETYKKALVMIKDMEIPAIEAEIQNDFSSFKAYCQLNDIKL